MSITKHFDKNNLHHAYLIEGVKENALPQIIEYIETIGIKTSGNPDFSNISFDTLKAEDARNIRSMGVERGISTAKRIFIISVNNFLPDAQNTLLKIFEEPIDNTHFFLIVPELDSLFKTFASRFYIIKTAQESKDDLKEAERFIAMSQRDRIEFLKDFLVADEEDAETETKSLSRSKALKFLNALEVSLHDKFLIEKNQVSSHNFFDQIFKVREYLRQSGSSVKSLMESVALVVPKF